MSGDLLLPGQMFAWVMTCLVVEIKNKNKAKKKKNITHCVLMFEDIHLPYKKNCCGSSMVQLW